MVNTKTQKPKPKKSETDGSDAPEVAKDQKDPKETKEVKEVKEAKAKPQEPSEKKKSDLEKVTRKYINECVNDIIQNKELPYELIYLWINGENTTRNHSIQGVFAKQEAANNALLALEGLNSREWSDYCDKIQYEQDFLKCCILVL